MTTRAGLEGLPIKLHCLGGQTPPRDIVDDFRGVHKLPPQAVAALWDVLVHCLGDEMTPQTEARMDQFCAIHGADGGVLSHVLKAARTLVRQAAALDLSAPVFAEDVLALCDGQEVAARTLAAGYESIKSALRQDIARLCLLDHGKVLDQIHWRADYVTGGSRGERFRLPVVMMTFGYREGDEKGRITLQMPREAVAQLRALCDKILA